jgi:hypothetical protein
MGSGALRLTPINNKRNRKETNMFIEHIAPDYYFVPLADLKRHSDGGIERSFATSEPALEWIKNHPGLVVKAVPRGGRGEKLAPQKPDPNFTELAATAWRMET